jgi:hypothetical protein
MNGTNQTNTRRRKTCPKSKKRKNRAGKKALNEGNYFGRNISQISKVGMFGANTFPPKLRTQLTYEDTGFLDEPAIGNGYFDYWKFRGNSIFDPDQDGVGSQPYYFDNLAAIYNRYRVLSSSIQVTFWCTSAADTVKNIKTCVYPFQLGSLPGQTEFNDLKRLPKCKYVQWNQDRNDFKSVIVSNKCNTSFFTENPWDQDWEAAVTGNPTIQWYWHITNDTSTLGEECEIYMDVKIIYDVIFCKRADIDES